MFKEFKEFAVKGNVIDLAVGIIIGGAFGTVVKSLVDDVIMPPIGLVLGRVDFSNLFLTLKAGPMVGAGYQTVAEAAKDGAVLLRFGAFGNAVVSFLIVSFAVFLLVRVVNKLKREEAVPTPEVEVVGQEIVLLTEIRDALRQR